MGELEKKADFKAALKRCLSELRQNLKLIYPDGRVPLSEHYKIKERDNGFTYQPFFKPNLDFSRIFILLHTQSQGYRQLSLVFEELLSERKLLHKLYGNTQTAMTLDGERLASSLMAFYIQRRSNMLFDNRLADWCYKRFFTHFSTEYHTTEYYAYVEGIGMIPKRVKFYKNLAIRQLTKSKLTKLSESDSFFKERYKFGIYPMPSLGPKLIIEGRIRTKMGDVTAKYEGKNEPESQKRSQSPYHIVCDVITSLRLISNDKILVSPVIITQPLLPYDRRSSSMSKNFGFTATATSDTCSRLSYKSLIKAKKICKVLQAEGDIHERLAISRDRLDWSSYRSVQEDEILDTMIGLEALTKKNLIVSKDEWGRGLAFDLSLSWAKTLRKKKKDQQKLFELIRTAYGRLRSPLAHGDTFDPQDVILITKAKEIFREAMIKIILGKGEYKAQSIKAYL